MASLKMSSLKKSIIGDGSENNKSGSSFSLGKLSGSAPRSSEGIYDKASSLFSEKPASNKLLSVPSGSASAFVKSIVPASAASAAATAAAPAGSSGWRYFLVFLILVFLFLNLFLFLIKPAEASITQMYAPIANFFNMKKAEPIKKDVKPTDSDGGVKKIEKALDSKAVKNNIDKDQPPLKNEKVTTAFKKLPEIPKADETDSRMQRNKPTSKAGYCYIGEDRGFRSCIEVGEGDVCMSGDIFPTQAVCINPNLRE